MYVDVAIPRGAPEALTYRLPDELVALVQVGVRVRVPLRRRTVPGMVVAVKESCDLDDSSLRPVSELLDTEPLLPAGLLELARFIAGYYRCPLGDTLAAMLPAALLRSDAEEVELTPKGAASEGLELPARQAELLETLRESGRIRLATLIARAGIATRSPVEALATAGLVRIKRQRRDRPPQVEVTAVALPDIELDELLARCSRAPKQQAVLEWLAEQGRPALVSEICTAVGCSAGVVRALIGDNLVQSFKQASPQRPRWVLRADDTRHQLSDEQQNAVDAVTTAIGRTGFAPFLLQGVTGSGKTEVYLRCLEAALEAGRDGLVLVPEIGLTPAAVGAVERRFGSQVAVLHSAQSDGERWREWRTIRAGGARVVVGPRSALFAPLAKLGLIVVDEEQDGAYKQRDAPRYNARDLALVLGQRLAAPVLLCSATPSTEAVGLVERGMATHLQLTRRVAGLSLPEVELVDLRAEPAEPGEQGRTLFSRRLRQAMAETIERGEQVILLMQRRGWAPVLMCRECGHRLQCPSCSVALVVHRRSHDLRCHYCGHSCHLPDTCPECSGTLLDPLGAGTEKVAHLVGQYFPGVSSAILDRDTVRRRSGFRETLGAFAAGQVQVLIGTQMVAKGHHFPNVTLTGVISADALLSLPDFRAGEQTFQLLTQVAGRAGRGDQPGRVIIQTYYPDHPAVLHAARHDVNAFLADELVFRRTFSYPPAARMALVRFEAGTAAAAQRTTEAAATAAQPLPDGVRLRGPAPAPLERIRERWRWQLLISANNRNLLRTVLERIEAVAVPATVHRVIDIDPLSTL
jgi:primosomal protein N' (replication factor Y)